MSPSAFLRRLLHGTLWSGLGSVAVRGLLTASLLVAARLLGPTAFGWVSLPHQAGGMVGTATGYGLSTAATKSVSQAIRCRPDEAVPLARGAHRLASVAAVALSLFGLAVALVAWSVGAETVALAALLGGPIAGLTSLQLTQFGLFASFGAYRRQTVSVVAGTLVGSIAIVAASVLQSLLAVVLSLLLLLGLQAFLLARGLRKEAAARRATTATSPHIGGSTSLSLRSTFRQLRGIAVPATLVAAAGSLAQLAGIGIVWATDPGGREFGLFAAANQCFVLLMFVPILLCNVLFPLLVEQSSSKASVGGVLGVILVAATPAFGLSFFVEPLSGWFGSQYGGIAPVLSLTLWAVAAAAVVRPLYLALAGLDAMALTPLLATASAVVLVGLAWRWRGDGATGLAAARVASMSLHAGLAAALLGRTAWTRRKRTRELAPLLDPLTTSPPNAGRLAA